MKVREFITMEHDIDVYDDVCEELGVAFCGPLELTDCGAKQFAEVMDFNIEILPAPAGYGYGCAIVRCDDPDEKSCEHKLRVAMDFFYSAAGQCAWDDYERWFKEVD